jgi:hypothetical protein
LDDVQTRSVLGIRTGFQNRFKEISKWWKYVE